MKTCEVCGHSTEPQGYTVCPDCARRAVKLVQNRIARTFTEAVSHLKNE